MWFWYIKHEYSFMSFEKKISSIWIFKILNVYKYCSYQPCMEFIWFLYKAMKTRFHTKFVQAYTA
jgi:hypothetical protein